MGPRMISAAVVNTTVPNTAPTVTSTSFTVQEDTTLTPVTLTYSDAENDLVTFWLPGIPTKDGVATMTTSGQLGFTPNKDFTGLAQIMVMGKG